MNNENNNMKKDDVMTIDATDLEKISGGNIFDDIADTFNGWYFAWAQNHMMSELNNVEHPDEMG